MKTLAVQPTHPSIRESMQEYARGLAGGLMFSLPLLYTMEVWFAGFIATPWRLLTLVAFTCLILLGYNRFAGLRHDSSWLEVAIDSVEELGLGILTATAVLYLLGRIGPDQSIEESLGKVVIASVFAAIGFSVGTAQLQAGNEADEGKDETPGRGDQFARELVIAFCGAILFAANVAPTEEIAVIAMETAPLRLAVLALLSLGIGSMVLYFSDFLQSEGVLHRHSPFDMFFGSALTYAVAIVASSLMLWFFGRFDGTALEVSIAQLVVLGFPAALGASAGRLLLS